MSNGTLGPPGADSRREFQEGHRELHEFHAIAGETLHLGMMVKQMDVMKEAQASRERCVAGSKQFDFILLATVLVVSGFSWVLSLGMSWILPDSPSQ